jgi:hypothetical protein
MTLEEAHILAQARLRALTVQAATVAWQSLLAYNVANVAQWLGMIVPLVLGAQHQSASLTSSFLAAAVQAPAVAPAARSVPLASAPRPMDFTKVTGAAIRAGVPPQEVYRRPFVTVWTMLQEQKPWADAIAAGLARAQATVAMDVQNTMRHTLKLVGDAEPLILGYRRIPDATACEFCKLIAGRRYLTSELQPVHPRCGCGVGVITEANRGDFTGKSENDLAITANGITAAVKMHGELGPLLVDGHDHFTGPDGIAA